MLASRITNFHFQLIDQGYFHVCNRCTEIWGNCDCKNESTAYESLYKTLKEEFEEIRLENETCKNVYHKLVGHWSWCCAACEGNAGYPDDCKCEKFYSETYLKLWEFAEEAIEQILGSVGHECKR